MIKREKHRVSLIVSRPRADYHHELIEQARPWFGPGIALELAGPVRVEVAERDRYGVEYAWRVQAWVRPVSAQSARVSAA